MQLQNYEALADYRDYVMYQRISTKRIDANLSSASATSFGLQPNNLQHLVASKQISFANTGMEDDNTHFDQEYYREEGIFEMDLWNTETFCLILLRSGFFNILVTVLSANNFPHF